MPLHKQPKPLLTLCVSAVAKRIVAQSESLFEESPDGTMPVNLELARREYVTSLPGTVRDMLLKEVNRLFSVPPHSFSTIYTAVYERSSVLSNFATGMLLGPDVQSVHMQQCCCRGCRHHEDFLLLLNQEGTGLKSLKLALPIFMTIEPALLQNTLIRPASLKQLYIPNICRNVYLQIIGSTCRNISLLDVSGSKYVTDKGLRELFLRKNAPFVEEVTSARDAPLCLDTSCGENDCTLLRLLLKIDSRMLHTNGNCKVSARSPASLRRILHYWKQETELCMSLRVLDIGNTSVTPRGAVLALMKAPQLRSFGSYKQVGSALELHDSCWSHVHQNSLVDHPKFGLQSVFTHDLTGAQLVLLYKYLPSLRVLSMYNHQLNTAALEFPSFALNVLRISNLSINGHWARELYSLGNTLQASYLQHLSLRCFPGEEQELNLHDLFQSCINLRTFRGIGMHLSWVQGMSGSDISMPHLRLLNVGQVVARNVVVETLKRCPKLEVVHFNQCPDLTDGDIVKATYHSSQHLKCFYLGEAPFLTAQLFSVMQTTYGNLSSIGDIAHWDILYEDTLRIERDILENNWDLELTDWKHQYCNYCNASATNFFV